MPNSENESVVEKLVVALGAPPGGHASPRRPSRGLPGLAAKWDGAEAGFPYSSKASRSYRLVIRHSEAKNLVLAFCKAR